MDNVAYPELPLAVISSSKARPVAGNNSALFVKYLSKN